MSLHISNFLCLPGAFETNRNLEITTLALAQPSDGNHTKANTLMGATPCEQHQETLIQRHINGWQRNNANANLTARKWILPTCIEKGPSQAIHRSLLQ
ncbi:hypothetical protein IQK56_15735 [Pseudomonas sp. MAFF 301449]|uniref:Uncharacterized protein n=1 Tax=Pseudomonas cyclaminis TaxID=2781239 RepID=A0ABR9SUI4_9PSED|nr:hypothetical protein [Pseudomonas cyclaminis]MBE8592269.1 hypothetical protein [Pseudomonas cyclaminis]MBE8599519.1 hypothetical protein [Pseudomonas cyclaminis]